MHMLALIYTEKLRVWQIDCQRMALMSPMDTCTIGSWSTTLHRMRTYYAYRDIFSTLFSLVVYCDISDSISS